MADKRLSNYVGKSGGVSRDLTPIGMMAPFPSDVDVQGWLKCDGRPYNPDLFPDLYAFLGIDVTPIVWIDQVPQIIWRIKAYHSIIDATEILASQVLEKIEAIDTKSNENKSILSNILYPGAFITLYQESPPPNFMVRNGAVIPNANVDLPNLWNALQNDPRLLPFVTDMYNWYQKSILSPWLGVGGVPLFAIDTSVNTIRLPDTRGMYQEDAGVGLSIGDVHPDAIRDIVGEFGADGLTLQNESASGVFSWSASNDQSPDFQSVNYGRPYLTFAASRIVPTAERNQPAAFGVLPCIYTG